MGARLRSSKRTYLTLDRSTFLTLPSIPTLKNALPEEARAVTALELLCLMISEHLPSRENETTLPSNEPESNTGESRVGNESESSNKSNRISSKSPRHFYSPAIKELASAPLTKDPTPILFVGPKSFSLIFPGEERSKTFNSPEKLKETALPFPAKVTPTC